MILHVHCLVWLLAGMAIGFCGNELVWLHAGLGSACAGHGLGCPWAALDMRWACLGVCWLWARRGMGDLRSVLIIPWACVSMVLLVIGWICHALRWPWPLRWSGCYGLACLGLW